MTVDGEATFLQLIRQHANFHATLLTLRPHFIGGNPFGEKLTENRRRIKPWNCLEKEFFCTKVFFSPLAPWTRTELVKNEAVSRQFRTAIAS
jgi:hypothetical protein